MISLEMASDTQEEYESIIEGRAVLRVTSNEVFYNPVQEFNRDLSIIVLNGFTEDYKRQLVEKAQKKEHGEQGENNITILEAFSATGLRSIRYAKEVVNVTKIIANDISEQAVETMKKSILLNNVEHIVETSLEDASTLMYRHKAHRKRFAAIDLDPYGCPAQFLDPAVQSVAEGGLLLVTATDMAVLAGNSPESCYSKYGAISLKTKCCHEMGLRILLQCIESHANRHSRYIVPLLSVSVDFYIRVFVRIYTGAIHCKKTTSKLAMVYRCVSCDSTTLQPLGAFQPNPKPKKPDQTKAYLPLAPTVGQFCDNCNGRHQMGGPIWAGPLHDDEFVARMFNAVAQGAVVYGTERRLRGVLAVLGEELRAPLYHSLDRLCSTVHVGSMPMMLLRSAIMNAGYKVSFSHANKLSVKTDAPNRLVWDIVRMWAAAQGVANGQAQQDPVARHILSQAVTYDVDFKMRADANPTSRVLGHCRFQTNPKPYWGPGIKSTVNSVYNQKWIKVKLNQNKRRLPSAESERASKRPPAVSLIIDSAADGGYDKRSIGSSEPDAPTKNTDQKHGYTDDSNHRPTNDSTDQPQTETNNATATECTADTTNAPIQNSI